MHILTIDDHPTFRRGLKDLVISQWSQLKPQSPAPEVRECACCREAEALGHEDFDLIFLDLHLPDVTGMEGIGRICEVFKPTRVIVLSADEDSEQIYSAVDAGALGYIRKSDPEPTFIAAVNMVLEGKVYIPPDALRRVKTSHSLTSREREVMDKLHEGNSNKEIARALNISPGTVKAHLYSAYRKLDTRNRTEAVLVFGKLDAQKTASF